MLGTDLAGQSVDLTNGDDVTATEPGAVSVAAGPLGSMPSFSTSEAGKDARLVSNDSGDLMALSAAFPDGTGTLSRYEQGAAEVLDRGEDPVTGIRWGRWSRGAISITNGAGLEEQLARGDASLHWIGATGEARPALPTTGTLGFRLTGNTNPTDNLGNVGTLGSASLFADFSTQTVDASVSLAIDATNQIWDAAVSGLDINRPLATFGGPFDTVTITDVTDPGNLASGMGSLDGFFTADPAGAIAGGGFGFSLSDTAGTSVSGAAAFQRD